MILADTFQITNEEKLSFTSLAFQAEYGDSIDNEQLPTDFVIEHYASNDLINQVLMGLNKKLFYMLHFSSMGRKIYDKKLLKDIDLILN
jgi:hypothetical protein